MDKDRYYLEVRKEYISGASHMDRRASLLLALVSVIVILKSAALLPTLLALTGLYIESIACFLSKLRHYSFLDSFSEIYYEEGEKYLTGEENRYVYVLNIVSYILVGASIISLLF